MDSADRMYDVAIIGAGVVGAAIARELARYQLRCVLIEAAADVGTGTSKANTAILHTGFDAKPGSLEARLVRRGHALLHAYGPEAGIPIEPLGALLVAWDAGQFAALPAIAENAARNGYTAVRPVGVEALYALEPHLGRGALGGLAIPDEGIICPFTPPLAFATEAVLNDVHLVLDSPVQAIRVSTDGVHAIVTPATTYRSRYAINAAGLHSDTIDRLFGHTGFTVTPRRGELIIFDKLARPLVNHILLPVPTKVSKGVLVSPTVFGNVLLGPTAEEVPNRHATGSTAAGMTDLLEKGRRILPALITEEVTAVYAGLRAATEHSDYQITFHPEQRYVCVGGIRSTGLSASMAIAEYVVDGLRDAGLVLVPKDDFRRVRMPNIGEAFERPYQSATAIAANPDYGRIVCHCERVTRGEILDALRGPIRAQSLDGVRRRTRALLGRCQGFFCTAAVTRLVADTMGQNVEELLGLDEPRSAYGSPLPSGTVDFLATSASTSSARAVGDSISMKNSAHPELVEGSVSDLSTVPSEGEGEERVDAVVVGGGPAGLAAGIELRRLGAGRVIVVDREEQAGGIPRHAAHTGFGLRDMHRLLTGPAYAARYVQLAQQAGVEVRTATTVTGWSGPTTLSLTSPAGLAALAARVVILATGCRERPRSARLIPGDRPAGVLTTGALQQLVYLHHLPIGRRAVIVGAEHVSFSAILTLAHAGVSTVAMITEYPQHQTYRPYKWLSSTRYAVPILTNHRVTGIVGRARVEAVDVADLRTGSTRRLDCDTVVFTGDWIPDHELARRAGLLMDDATRAPRVDGALRTSVRGVFAAGNLLHAAETADIAALGGRHAARSAQQFLENGSWPETPPIPIVCEPPLLWVSPSAVTPGAAPPRGCFVLRVSEYCRNVQLVVSQGSRVLRSRHYRRLTPNLPFHVASSWEREVDAAGEHVRFRLDRAPARSTTP